MRHLITNANRAAGIGGESSYLACSKHVGCVETRLKTDAYAFWPWEPGYGEIRSVTLPELAADTDAYLHRRLAEARAGRLTVTVDHADRLVLARTSPR